MLHPSGQHPLLPLPPRDGDRGATSADGAASPHDVRRACLSAGIDKVAFLRHGNTGKAADDFDRILTELGRSQARAAGSSYGAGKLHPYYRGGALCSVAPRCKETAKLFFEASSEKTKESGGDADAEIPPILLRQEIFDGTKLPEGDRLWDMMSYSPLRRYLENPDEGDAEAARIVYGAYARDGLDLLWDVISDASKGDASSVEKGRTLLFFSHAVYLCSVGLAFAAAIGCGSGDEEGATGDEGGVDLLLDTNTREAEGYCINVESQTVSLLLRPQE
ncbi:hypothetical protein ACHAWF_005562 [Thalassiosira exigua]